MAQEHAKSRKAKKRETVILPLTPVQAVTDLDEHWPFFRF